jgi:3-deoxy-D-manno-octulosonate 8-phosphate phosphatase (KDO 8-P phosphatase)
MTNENEKLRRAASIKMVVFDVDGVLTDGSIMLDASGSEIKRFNVKDGSGMKFLRRSGLRLAIISGRESAAVEARASDLGIEYVYQGCKQKLPAYEDLKKRAGLDDDEIAYIGDDLPDVPVMRRCGLAVAVADAVGETRSAAHHVTAAVGGKGAARELAEWLLRAQGRWEAILSRYFPPGDIPVE